MKLDFDSLWNSFFKYMTICVIGITFSIYSYYHSEHRELMTHHIIRTFVETYNTSLPMATYQHRKLLYLKNFISLDSDISNELNKNLKQLEIENENRLNNAGLSDIRGVIDFENNGYSNTPAEFVLAICTKIERLNNDAYGVEFLTSKCNTKSWHCDPPNIHIASVKIKTGGTMSEVNPIGIVVTDYRDNKI